MDRSCLLIPSPALTERCLLDTVGVVRHEAAFIIIGGLSRSVDGALVPAHNVREVAACRFFSDTRPRSVLASAASPGCVDARRSERQSGLADPLSRRRSLRQLLIPSDLSRPPTRILLM